MEGPNQAK